MGAFDDAPRNRDKQLPEMDENTARRAHQAAAGLQLGKDFVARAMELGFEPDVVAYNITYERTGEAHYSGRRWSAPREVQRTRAFAVYEIGGGLWPYWISANGLHVQTREKRLWERKAIFSGRINESYVVQCEEVPVELMDHTEDIWGFNKNPEVLTVFMPDALVLYLETRQKHGRWGGGPLRQAHG